MKAIFVCFKNIQLPASLRSVSLLVKKTLSIPYWLNVEAERQGINFSHTLQNAIKQQLNIAT